MCYSRVPERGVATRIGIAVLRGPPRGECCACGVRRARQAFRNVPLRCTGFTFTAQARE